MNMLNQIILEGNCAEDCNIETTVSGVKLGTVKLAVNRSYKNAVGEVETEVSYFDVEMYGNVADFLEKHLKKGCGVRIVGRLKQKIYECNGKQCSKVVVIAEHIELKPCVTDKNKEEVK